MQWIDIEAKTKIHIFICHSTKFPDWAYLAGQKSKHDTKSLLGWKIFQKKCCDAVRVKKKTHHCRCGVARHCLEILGQHERHTLKFWQFVDLTVRGWKLLAFTVNLNPSVVCTYVCSHGRRRSNKRFGDNHTDVHESEFWETRLATSAELATPPQFCLISLCSSSSESSDRCLRCYCFHT